jgi:hypothetical protein
MCRHDANLIVWGMASALDAHDPSNFDTPDDSFNVENP